MRIISLLIILVIGLTPVLAQTAETFPVFSATPEARGYNYWTEFDITFCQTIPFMMLWGYLLDRQISTLLFPGSKIHWEILLLGATAISAWNADNHARKVLQGN